MDPYITLFVSKVIVEGLLIHKIFRCATNDESKQGLICITDMSWIKMKRKTGTNFMIETIDCHEISGAQSLCD